MHITMVGHSTVLIETGGTRLITDPYFGTRGHIAYGRLRPPGIARGDIGAVDGVLVSHGHWDHTDRRYLRSLGDAVPVLIPAGTALLMRLKGARHVVPLRPWMSRTIGAVTITAVPALHLAITIGFVVRSAAHCLYFAGDTYHRPFIARVGRTFKPDVALMPVTTYRSPTTMGERGAVKAARDLQAPTIIPIHLGIQPRSPLLRTTQSVAGFERRLRAAGITSAVVHLREGEQWIAPPVRGARPPSASALG